MLNILQRISKNEYEGNLSFLTSRYFISVGQDAHIAEESVGMLEIDY